MTTLKNTDGRKYNRKSNRDLNAELNVWCLIPERFTNYFKKLPSGSWLISIPELYFISESFDTLKEAVDKFIEMNNRFENSDELRMLANAVSKYR